MKIRLVSIRCSRYRFDNRLIDRLTRVTVKVSIDYKESKFGEPSTVYRYKSLDLAFLLCYYIQTILGLGLGRPLCPFASSSRFPRPSGLDKTLTLNYRHSLRLEIRMQTTFN